MKIENSKRIKAFRQKTLVGIPHFQTTGRRSMRSKPRA